MVEICNLASGSNGNCYYIGNDTDAVIVDAGIYHSRLVERAGIAGLDIGKIRAIFVTHEHHDHVGGSRVISKRLMVPVYATARTFHAIHKKHQPADFKPLEPNSVTEIKGIKVWAFSKSHDAADPVSYRVEIDGHNIGVMTDIGIADERLCKQFSLCDAAFLESNYDLKMLREGGYPYYLKERVESEIGHLSNDQAAELVRNFGNPMLSHLILSHISAENNTPEKVMEAFSEFSNKYKISLAPRHACGPVIRL
ncbi:MAG: MBL fold metallo-hydrolase [Bacteroidales bacterium]|nr:MBL fold metallo-hydrolase [Bacteroidales bacterium]